MPLTIASTLKPDIKINLELTKDEVIAMIMMINQAQGVDLVKALIPVYDKLIRGVKEQTSYE